MRNLVLFIYNVFIYLCVQPQATYEALSELLIHTLWGNKFTQLRYSAYVWFFMFLLSGQHTVSPSYAGNPFPSTLSRGFAIHF